MLHVQQRSVVPELFFVGGHFGACLRLVPLETLVTEPLIPKERTFEMDRAALVSVRSFLERGREDGEFGGEVGVDERGRGGKSSSAGIFLSSSLLLVGKWSPASVLLAASSDGTELTVSWCSCWELDKGGSETCAAEGTASLLLLEIISQLAEASFIRAS